jgi:hypothetical protein
VFQTDKSLAADKRLNQRLAINDTVNSINLFIEQNVLRVQYTVTNPPSIKLILVYLEDPIITTSYMTPLTLSGNTTTVLSLQFQSIYGTVLNQTILYNFTTPIFTGTMTRIPNMEITLEELDGKLLSDVILSQGPFYEIDTYSPVATRQGFSEKRRQTMQKWRGKQTL